LERDGVNVDQRLGLMAAGAFVVTFVLGASVAGRNPSPFDAMAAALRGQATPLAILFTRSGYWYVLAGLFVVSLGLCILYRRELPAFAVLGGVQLLSQFAVEGVKGVFKRTRPDDWLFHKELGYSFPSGHAVTAVVFYGGLLLVLWSIPMPRVLRIAVSTVLGIWIAGIPWSRVALGAHYASDVLGGAVFGAGWLCIMMLVLRHLPAVAARF
jgi:membrane-associated phospholipid phosphatase